LVGSLGIVPLRFPACSDDGRPLTPRLSSERVPNPPAGRGASREPHQPPANGWNLLMAVDGDPRASRLRSGTTPDYCGSDIRLDAGTQYRREAWPRSAIAADQRAWRVPPWYRQHYTDHMSSKSPPRSVLCTPWWRSQCPTRVVGFFFLGCHVAIGIPTTGRSSSPYLNSILSHLCCSHRRCQCVSCVRAGILR